MSSGVTLEDDVIDRFNKDFKMVSSSKFNWQIFSFTDDKKKIKIDSEGCEDDELLAKLKKMRDDKKACYFVYHQKDGGKDGTKSGTKVKLVMYSDDDFTAIGDRMIGASSFDCLKKKLQGIQIERQIHSFDDLLEDLCLSE